MDEETEASTHCFFFIVWVTILPENDSSSKQLKERRNNVPLQSLAILLCPQIVAGPVHTSATKFDSEFDGLLYKSVERPSHNKFYNCIFYVQTFVRLDV